MMLSLFLVSLPIHNPKYSFFLFVNNKTNCMRLPYKTDSEDEIGTPANPSEKQKNDAMKHIPPKSLKQQVPSAPAPAPIEVHKAAIRAAFQDKSVSRAELFWTLLPYITLAEAEEILIRRKGEAEVEHK
jgi:hypothetical protein